jgi:hypothetical protein
MFLKTPRKIKSTKKERHVSQSALLSKSTIVTIYVRIKTLRASEKVLRPLIAMKNVAWSGPKSHTARFM